MAAFSTEEKVSLLIKKNLGKPSTDPNLAFFSEPSFDSRPRVFTNQIFSNAIPTTRPTTGWAGTGETNNVPGDLSDGETSVHSGGVLKFYYKWPLEQVTNGNDSAFKAEDDDGVNPLQGSIPFNYDPAGGYGVKLYRRDGESPGNRIFDGTGEWVVDPDAGILTFYEAADVSGFVDGESPPFLSFYRYVGATGLSAATPWTSTSDGIHYDEGSAPTVMIGVTTPSDAALALEVEGDAKFHNTVTAEEVLCVSDRRLKKNIRPIPQPLPKINALRGVRFQWKKNDAVSYGVVADEIERVMPGCTLQNGAGFLSVNYNAATALLIETVKQQSDQIRTLQAKMDAILKLYGEVIKPTNSS